MNGDQRIDPEKLARYFADDPALSQADREIVADWLRSNHAFVREVEGQTSRPDLTRAKRQLQARMDRPGIREANQPEGSIAPSRPKVFRLIRIAAACLLIGVAGYLYIQYGRDATVQQLQSAEIVTEPGELQEFHLPDRSSVVLGPASRLVFSSTGRNGVREVVLEGEAYFDVTEDGESPFLVRAGDAVVRVVGTQFNIQAYPDEDQIQVVVAEGLVQVDVRQREGQGPVVSKGELAVVTRADLESISVASGINIENHLGWLDGRLDFANIPLTDAIRRLERWHDVDILLAGETLGNRRVTGSFEDETVLEVIQVLSVSLDLDFERDGRTFVLMSRHE